MRNIIDIDAARQWLGVMGGIACKTRSPTDTDRNGGYNSGGSLREQTQLALLPHL